MDAAGPITLKTVVGPLKGVLYTSDSGSACFVVSKESHSSPPLVRLHSSCLFSESFHSNDCDCASQLDAFLTKIAAEGGYLLYLFEEGRGTGLMNKVRAVKLQQDSGIDTGKAFEDLGYTRDPRDYAVAIETMHALNLPVEIRLATNNPGKVAAVEKAGYKIVERVQLQYATSKAIDDYLQMKVRSLSHHAKE